ncbi:hypothetical protein Glove_13g266 [Diversispora epigaea]|uniref:Uncharacterized protein n=1 Tax=Diversispora epigaea TaxID=1348612 RepID=A0A397JQI2_9GLOM|nr:hypothetical protein Glove_13g266 [Diversispora epigaea]
MPFMKYAIKNILLFGMVCANFQNGKWTSGNRTTDRLIQYTQQKNEIFSINGGSGDLKKFENTFANLNEVFLNELFYININYKFKNKYYLDLYSLESKNGMKYGSVQFYGITKDPETNEYILVLNYVRGKTHHMTLYLLSIRFRSKSMEENTKNP